jgi:hypothetical protein
MASLPHPVGCEDNNSPVVLKGAQKHTDAGISMNISVNALLLEYIYLIQNEERLLFRSTLKDER